MTVRPTFDPGFSTESMESIFSSKATVGAILEFEKALVLALAEVGIATENEAVLVAAACDQGVDDPTAILATTWEAGTPILELRKIISERAGEAPGRWFHHGATTQDAIDTGLMLQCRRGLEAVDRDLSSLGTRLRDLTTEFRDQPQMGRTFLQDSRPTTFGFRTASWLSRVLDHHDDVRNRIMQLPVQLGGSDGMRSDYGEQGATVMSHLAEQLGLASSEVSWHTDRGGVLAIVQCLVRLAATMAKIATDVAILASSAFGEISVRSGGSSSMPGKQNPIDSVRAIAAASACSGSVAMLTSAPPVELERGVGAWHVEWLAVPLAFRTTGAAVEAMRVCLDSLEVSRTAMSAHVDEEPVAAAGSQIDVVLERAASFLG